MYFIARIKVMCIKVIPPFDEYNPLNREEKFTQRKLFNLGNDVACVYIEVKSGIRMLIHFTNLPTEKQFLKEFKDLVQLLCYLNVYLTHFFFL